MHVAYLSTDPGVPVFGQKGCSVHVQEVLRALRRRGAHVSLITQRLGGMAPADLAAVPVHLLPPLPACDAAGREQAARGVNPAITALLEERGPFDLVYERYALWSYAGMEYARTHGIPGLLEVNAPLIEEQATHRGLADRAAAEAVAARVFGAATALLAVSTEVATYLAQYPAARGRVQVVPNGVDPARFPAGRPSGPRSRFTVGFVGTLKPWHGLATLVAAFALLHARVPAARLLIVGDGPERAGLEADLDACGLGAVAEFTGAVDPAQIAGHLAEMDVAVAPYPARADFYFSPLKLYEYMAAGVPVVASCIGQIADVLRDGETGLLCPPDDPAALAVALDRLREDPALGRRLGAAARAAVMRDHTWDAVADRILALAQPVPVGAGR
ncbi:MAG TPA: glycosyltransferase family 4 protein [Chloroflexia bacterium]|nr:glycosyltransferase family 4 protein [Chloroflexia bacterium]